MDDEKQNVSHYRMIFSTDDAYRLPELKLPGPFLLPRLCFGQLRVLVRREMSRWEIEDGNACAIPETILLYSAERSVHFFESAFLQSLLHWIYDVNNPCSFQPLKKHK